MSAFANSVAIRLYKYAAKSRVFNKTLPTLKLALHAMDGSITHIDAPPPPPERYVFLHVHAVDRDWFFEPLPEPAPQVGFIEGASIFEEGVGSVFADQPDLPVELVYMPANVRAEYHATAYPENPATINHTSPVNAETPRDDTLSPSHDEPRVRDDIQGMSADDLAAIAAIEKDRLERAKDKTAQPATTPVAKQPAVAHAQPAPFTGPKDWAANLLKQIKKDQ